MRAGLLTEHIDILTPKLTLNSVGEQVTEYEFKYSTKARIVNRRRSREQQNGEVWYPGAKTIEVRIYHAINTYDLVKWMGKKYRILSIDYDRANMCQRLELEEVNE